jgi:hypothetical protein
MPLDRWNKIQGVAITDSVYDALDRQDRGWVGAEDRKADDQRILSEANIIIDGETRRWQRGLPFEDEPTPAPAAPELTPVPTGTPVPGTPGMPPSPAPAGNMPADIGPPATPATPSVSARITVRMPDGTLQDMLQSEWDRFTPEEQAQMQIASGPQVPGALPNDVDTPGARPAQVIPRTVVDPNTGELVREEDASGIPTQWLNPDTGRVEDLPPRQRPAVPAAVPPEPAAPPAAAAPSPAAAPPIAPIKLPPNPPINAPFQDEAPNRRPPPPKATAPVPKAPAPAPKPAVPPRATPASTPPASIAPPAPAPPPPPPFEQDAQGAVLAENRFTRSIAQAGGRPTQRVAERVAREVGEVFRPGEQGGYRGDTGGWRTLAHQAAAAWEEQYKAEPNSLKASEREAYERNPRSLHETILQADSPFRDYRESWIGAARVGQVVPGAREFTGQVGAYPQYGQAGGLAQDRLNAAPPGTSDITDAGGVPREMTPSTNTRPGAPLTPATSPAEEPPINIPGGVRPEDLVLPASELRDADGRPREYTPSSRTGVGAPLDGAAPEPTVVIVTPDDIGPPELTPESPFVESPVSRRGGRASPELMAMMDTGGGMPATTMPEERFPNYTPQYRRAIEVVDQAFADGLEREEIIQQLADEGFADPERWLDRVADEEYTNHGELPDPRGTRPIKPGPYVDSLPPDLSPDMRMPEVEEDFYGPNRAYPTEPTSPEWRYYPQNLEPGGGLRDEYGNPLMYAEGDYGDYTAEYQPDYGDYTAEYQPEYYEPEYETVAEAEPEYTEEPSYDYEYEYEPEYA